MGNNVVGVKVCNPSDPQAAGRCQHTLDRIGLPYNMPNNAKNGTFEYCDSDPMDIPGVYTSNGATYSYSQPPESLGPITSIPYTARVPSSFNCQTFQSAAVWTDFAELSTAVPTPTATPSGSAGAGAGKGASNGSGTRSGTAAIATSTGSNGTGTLTVSLLSTILGVVFSVVFLA
jgi:hypothetical protein